MTLSRKIISDFWDWIPGLYFFDSCRGLRQKKSFTISLGVQRSSHYSFQNFSSCDLGFDSTDVPMILLCSPELCDRITADDRISQDLVLQFVFETCA